MSLNRRNFLKQSTALAAASATVGAGLPAFAQSGNLEIFSWWTSGGEAAALEALVSTYEEMFPGNEVVNAAVAGGGGTNALPVLQARLAGGDPPDTWQGNPGTAFISQYVDGGYADDITDLYEEEGWLDKIPQPVIDTISKDGRMYAVHVGVHRCNQVWYNRALMQQAGVEVGDTMSFDEFFAAAERLRSAGINPLAVGDNGIWANARMFENTFVGVLGFDQTQKLWSGDLSFDSPEFKEAIDIHGRMLDFQNADHSSLSWDQAVRRVIDGQSAMNMMGDWAYGEFAKAGVVENEDYGYVSHPGTDDIFVLVTDCFPIASGSDNKEQARNWLRAVGSTTAQERFSVVKGAVAPRLDADQSNLPPYLQWSYERFANDRFVGSSVNGIQVPAPFVQDHFDALTTFVVSKNVDRFAQALARAQQEYL